MDIIKAVVFDWGGVLISNPAPGLISFCSSVLGVATDDFIRVQSIHAPFFQKGLLSEEEFWRRICFDLQVPLPCKRSLWGDAFRAAYRPVEEMFALVSSLHMRGYRTAILSNTEDPAVAYFEELAYSMFDVTVFSCREKIMKPERGIYELTLRRLDVAPTEALFIDDRADFLEGARSLGMNILLCNDPLDTVRELKFRLNPLYRKQL